MIELFANGTEVFTPMAAGVLGVLGTLFGIYMKGDAIVDMVAKRATAKQAEEAKQSPKPIPQPMLTQAVDALVPKGDYEHHLARNRDAHKRFRDDIDKVVMENAHIRTEIATLSERTRTQTTAVDNVTKRLNRCIELLSNLRGRVHASEEAEEEVG